MSYLENFELTTFWLKKKLLMQKHFLNDLSIL